MPRALRQLQLLLLWRVFVIARKASAMVVVVVVMMLWLIMAMAPVIAMLNSTGAASPLLADTCDATPMMQRVDCS